MGMASYANWSLEQTVE